MIVRTDSGVLDAQANRVGALKDDLDWFDVRTLQSPTAGRGFGFPTRLQEPAALDMVYFA